MENPNVPAQVAAIAASFRERVNPHIEELFDAYILIGYSTKDHHRIVLVNPGSDQACVDGLAQVVAAANMWQMTGHL
jgi:hypothetical protein